MEILNENFEFWNYYENFLEKYPQILKTLRKVLENLMKVGEILGKMYLIKKMKDVGKIYCERD